MSEKIEPFYPPMLRRSTIQTMKSMNHRTINNYKLIIENFECLIEQLEQDNEVLEWEIERIDMELRRKEEYE